MSGLPVSKRAWFAVIRKPARNITIWLIITVIFTALVAQSGVRSTMHSVSSAIESNVGAGFTAVASDGGLELTTAQRLNDLAEVSDHSFEAETLAKPINANIVQLSQGIQIDPDVDSDGEELGLGNQVRVIGTDNAELYPDFQGRLYNLEAGQQLKGDKASALIHRAFADQNGLTIGSQLTLEKEGRKVSVKITGIYSGNSDNPSGLPAEAAENTIFTDLASAQTLNGDTRLSLARYLTNQAATLENAISKAKQVAPEVMVEGNAQQFSGVLDAIKNVEKLLGAVLIGCCLAGGAVLVLVLVFWVRNRVHEIGILLSLGKSKLNILSQFVLEIAGLTIAALIVAVPLGLSLSTKLGAFVLSRAGDQAIGTLPVSHPDLASCLGVLLLGCGTVLLAAALVLTPVLRRTPKSILSLTS